MPLQADVVFKPSPCLCRDVSNQDAEGDANFQKSTGALISDKDRELETLRNEVPVVYPDTALRPWDR